MNEILALIQENGPLFYLITFVWTALEGETFVIFAGLAAQRGLLNIYVLFLAAGLGGMLGDQVCFFLGRQFGRRILARKPGWEPQVKKVSNLLEKHATVFILTYRFMYGLRNVSAIAIGMSTLCWRRFAVLNAIASFLWSFVFCGGGYLFGRVLEQMGLADTDSVNIEVRTLMITVLLLFVLVVTIRVIVSRHKGEEKEPKP